MFFLCLIERTVTIPLIEYQELKRILKAQSKQIEELQAEVVSLRAEIGLLKSGRKSTTSSTPSSQDYTRSKVYNSREKSNNPSGGQKGHKGSSLKMSDNPDEIVNYKPNYCNRCGAEFDFSNAKLHTKRQEIVIPPISPKYIEHRAYQCTCNQCGNATIAEMPQRLKANIQYVENVQALITYLSVYQYIPANRLKKFLKDFANLQISEGTIFNVLSSMSSKAQPSYEQIRQRLAVARYVGGDETGAHINKAKAWFWIFQNDFLTFIRASYSRGYQTIIESFSEGFPQSVYVSDSLAAQLKIKTKAKQLCLAHLSRELKKFEDVFSCQWATRLKLLFKETMTYKKQMQASDYYLENLKIKKFEKVLTNLLSVDTSQMHQKERTFVNRLIKRRDAIFTFLYYKEVPPDNNASERGIRNIKVKMKVSNQFKSYDFAQHFAVIRSVVDTTIKNGQDVFSTLTNLANSTLPH
jgi:transposase